MEWISDRDDDNDDENSSWDTEEEEEEKSTANAGPTSVAGPSRTDRNSNNERKNDFNWVVVKEEEEKEANVGPPREDDDDDDDEEEVQQANTMKPSKETITGPLREASEAGPSRPNLISHFVVMGFSEEMVVKALKENGEEDTNAILETLLTYSAIENSPSKQEDSPNCRYLASDTEGLDEDFSDMDEFEYEEFTDDLSEKDRIVSTLVDMGFLAEEASSAIDRCGKDASVLELADSIRAAQLAEECEDQPWYRTSSCAGDEGYACHSIKGKRKMGSEMGRDKKRSYIGKGKKVIRSKTNLNFDGDMPSFSIPNPMIGFGLPFEKPRITDRKLPEAAIGPPYFYYENVALAPKGVWDTISRFLYDIEPEFVDSKYFSAAARKRGYIHNLPIVNRFPLQPIPPKTIYEAFPTTRNYWPKWDPRTQLNCLQTCIASAQLTERIRKAVAESGDPPPRHVQAFVLHECRKWNLIWVGRHKVAALEPDEIETLLGFPRNHTRGGGISRTDRYKSLGNSFQIDTVAYHLSVLKDKFPNGMNVLSLFSGIGGAEVALHRLGIRLKTVVSVEISEVNRNIVRSWWEQTNQTGNLIDFADVQEMSGDRLENLMSTYGRFDLVIGGSPCNNLAGSNRHTRDGLEGEHSSLFYHYFRILDLVKCIMANNT
ncbi:DNA (cytosine-5)-methyltransferase DRM2-like [Iris pallida]|uniref:DNA (cytosine-5-)-methyltransferase n=1 Tax=Iris pallida TaxID=29817 RepID=A0AAX6GSR2_IRIPA|nr:DNA (cytosine-5)-methyltransferase DRM2-like [Iris pallida]KAJ6831377.1 DNA (cytosine-5)-methyltransferase DRM2-like [Iris pallida]